MLRNLLRASLLVLSGVLLVVMWGKFQKRRPTFVDARPAPTYQAESGPAPRFVTYYLGGLNLVQQDWGRWGEHQAKYDLSNGYMLSSHDSPDGCEYILELRPFRRQDEDTDSEEFKRTFQGARVPLVTGRGVSMGHSPQQVEKNIGQPTKKYSGQDTLRYEYIYRGKRFYNADYYFDKNKLQSVRIREAAPPNKYNNRLYGGCP